MILPETRLFRSVVTAVIWLGLWCSTAYAHGGIAGPDELGPPVITAAALGIAGYWTVMLWPSRRNNGTRRKGPLRSQTKPNRSSITAY